jgi:hypothetical protein
MNHYQDPKEQKHEMDGDSMKTTSKPIAGSGPATLFMNHARENTAPGNRLRTSHNNQQTDN